MKKIVNVNLAILLAFVLASGIFAVSGSVYAQGNGDEDQENNENGADSENGADTNVNPLTGTDAPAEEVAANVTAFANATSIEDVTEQAGNITSSGAPGELDYSSGENATSSNATSPTSNTTSTTTVQ
ncbi:hypothetical protein [Candidatus Nitrosocosmicus franklandus]|nr:hypothetical protein [Candidatus Nitrosocosmicus franklandus]